MKNDYCIYIHISPSNKRYIGITSQKPEYRWKNGNGYKAQQHFYRAIEKYGWDNFEHIIIAKGLTEDEAKWLEIELIREWDSTNREKGYNIALGGEGYNGVIPSEETRRKISENHADVSGENNPMFGKTSHNARKVILLNTKEIFSSTMEGAKKYNVDSSCISKCCNGKRKSSGKSEDGEYLVWMYYDEYLNITEEEVERRLNDADIRVVCITTNEVFFSAREGARVYNTYQQQISKCCNGKIKSAGKHPITGEELVWVLYKNILKKY